MELPTETRWRCARCGEDIPEAKHTVFPEPKFICPDGKLSSLAFVHGCPERGHVIRWTEGGRPGVIGGWRWLSRPCGPVRLVTVETQELLIEWLMSQ